MSSQNITKNISSITPASFYSIMKKLLNEAGAIGIGIKHRSDVISTIFTLLSTWTCWIDDPTYIKFKVIVISKGYELIEELNREENILIIEPEICRHICNTIDTTLKMTCCNKKVKGKKGKKGKYCKNTKVGEYCTFHASIKQQISHCVLKTIDLHIFKDISNIILDYVSL
jgi:hypothetical protein